MTLTQTGASAPNRLGAVTRAGGLSRTMVTLAGAAGGLGAWMTFAYRQELDPMSGVFSDSIYVTSGALLFPLTVALLAGSGMCLLVLLRRHAALTVSTRYCFSMWGLGLLLCAAAPADPPNGRVTLSGELHRVGGAGLIVGFALLGWCLVRSTAVRPSRGRRSALARIVLAYAAAATVFGLTVVLDPSVAGLSGRIALATQVAVLCVAAYAIETPQPTPVTSR